MTVHTAPRITTHPADAKALSDRGTSAKQIASYIVDVVNIALEAFQESGSGIIASEIG